MRVEEVDGWVEERRNQEIKRLFMKYVSEDVNCMPGASGEGPSGGVSVSVGAYGDVNGSWWSVGRDERGRRSPTEPGWGWYVVKYIHVYPMAPYVYLIY